MTMREKLAALWEGFKRGLTPPSGPNVISLRYICELDVLQLPRYRVELIAGSVALARDGAHGDWVKWGDVMLLLDGHRYATDAEAREAGQRMMAKHQKTLERLAKS
jgi:hypothetical protein